MIYSALVESADKGELLLCEGGLCRFHLRRDGVVVVREIIVLPEHRRVGVGRRMIAWLKNEFDTSIIRARCPASYETANAFWEAMGFSAKTPEKTRVGDTLNVWECDLR